MKHIHLKTTVSTNQSAWEHLNHLTPPLVIIADTQTAGRGRGTNAWISPEGNLYLSVGLKTEPGRLYNLSVRIAIHICNNLNRKLLRDSITIKWPNDLMIGNAKVGGILVESRIRGESCLVVAGIGLNTEMAPLPTAAAMKDRLLMNREEAAILITAAILDAVSDTAVLSDHLSRMSWFTEGDMVSYLENGKLRNGRFTGYDHALAMIVSENGDEHPLSCSTVSRVRSWPSCIGDDTQ